MFLLVVLLVLFAAPADAAELDGLIDRNLDGMMALQLEWGGFQDPLSGPQFNYGAVGLAWLAGERQPQRREAAAVTLRAASRVPQPGAFQVWLEALALGSDWLDPSTRAALTRHLESFREPLVGPRAQACHARTSCYSNLKLVDAVATLQLVRTGIAWAYAGPRMAAALTLLGERIPAVQDARMAVHADVDVGDAAILSDPSRNPLAYHVLSTAMLVRAVRQVDEPPATRRAARRALWALVALADPRGIVAWMGRGQDNTWTLGASTYAALAGAVEFADEPELAARLRRLSELTRDELWARSGTAGLAMLPGRRSSLVGADHSQNTIVSNGLALVFLHLAALEARDGPTAPLPAEVPGMTMLDPAAAGVAAVRAATVWFGVHRAATNPHDARYDAGLLSAQVKTAQGWQGIVGQRPNTDGARTTPLAGPLLLHHGHPLAPAGRLRAGAGRIELRGRWGGAVPMRLTYAATADGVRLRLRCPRGDRLRLVEWGPAAAAVRTRHGLRLPGRMVTASAVVRARRLPGRYASADDENVEGTALIMGCGALTLDWEWAPGR